MLAKDFFTQEDQDFMVAVRREIHQWPEGGFDLPKTMAVIERELDKAGISWTDKLGKSSVVATVNPNKTGLTIAIRADIDALPVTEKTGLPFASKREGFMHACGHDAHTAILLGTARVINRIADKLNCRVKFIFQSCEESAFDKTSGADLLCKDGVLDDVDMIIGLHVSNKMQIGNVAYSLKECNASSNPIDVEFFGKTSHAVAPQHGADALAMAVKFINDYQYVLTRRVAPYETIASSVCSLHTNTDTYNVVPDYARIKMTLRTYDDSVNDFVEGEIKTLANNIASEMGGTAKVRCGINYPALINDTPTVMKLIEAQKKVVGQEHCIEFAPSLGSEDFAYYSRLKPAAYFRLGTANDEKGFGGASHSNAFTIDEDAFSIGAQIFTQFVIDNGI